MEVGRLLAFDQSIFRTCNDVRSNWHAVTIAVTAGAIVCAAVFLLSTMPPRSITMATRPVGGGYNEIGRQYQALLAKAGVELRLVVTAGSVENLALLRDPRSGVDVALVQGGSVGKTAGGLESGLERCSMSRCGSSIAAAWRARHLPPCAAGRSPSDRSAAARMRFCSGCSSAMSSLRMWASCLRSRPRRPPASCLPGEIDAAALLAAWDAPVALTKLIAGARAVESGISLLGVTRAAMTPLIRMPIPCSNACWLTPSARGARLALTYRPAELRRLALSFRRCQLMPGSPPRAAVEQTLADGSNVPIGDIACYKHLSKCSSQPNPRDADF